MLGTFDDQGRLFSYLSLEQRVPAQHPLRTIRELVREVLRNLDRDFRTLYATTGGPVDPARTVAERTAAARVLRRAE